MFKSITKHRGEPSSGAAGIPDSRRCGSDTAPPQQLAEVLASENIFTWDGNFYAQALSAKSYTALRYVHTPHIYTQLFPEYHSHPKYQKMLKDIGLDAESIAKLEIPPLPF